jgi:hypothetical protein
LCPVTVGAVRPNEVGDSIHRHRVLPDDREHAPNLTTTRVATRSTGHPTKDLRNCTGG